MNEAVVSSLRIDKPITTRSSIGQATKKRELAKCSQCRKMQWYPTLVLLVSWVSWGIPHNTAGLSTHQREWWRKRWLFFFNQKSSFSPSPVGGGRKALPSAPLHTWDPQFLTVSTCDSAHSCNVMASTNRDSQPLLLTTCGATLKKRTRQCLYTTSYFII